MGHIDESYALVSFIVKLASENGRLGKKAAQKLMHIITSLGRVPSKYKFQLYTYGPFSRELAGDMDILDTLEAISISYNSDKNAYEIHSGPRSEEILNRYKDFLEANSPVIQPLIERFRGRLAKQLEVTSTLLFIIENNLIDDVQDDEVVINKFSEIKPHYSKGEIVPALSELRQFLN